MHTHTHTGAHKYIHTVISINTRDLNIVTFWVRYYNASDFECPVTEF